MEVSLSREKREISMITGASPEAQRPREIVPAKLEEMKPLDLGVNTGERTANTEGMCGFVRNRVPTTGVSPDTLAQLQGRLDVGKAQGPQNVVRVKNVFEDRKSIGRQAEAPHRKDVERRSVASADFWRKRAEPERRVTVERQQNVQTFLANESMMQKLQDALDADYPETKSRLQQIADGLVPVGQDANIPDPILNLIEWIFIHPTEPLPQAKKNTVLTTDTGDRGKESARAPFDVQRTKEGEEKGVPQKESDRLLGEIQKAGEVFRTGRVLLFKADGQPDLDENGKQKTREADFGDQLGAFIKIIGLGINYVQALFGELQKGEQMSGAKEQGADSAEDLARGFLGRAQGSEVEKLQSAVREIRKQEEENTKKIGEITQTITTLENKTDRTTEDNTKLQSLRTQKAILEQQNRVLAAARAFLERMIPQLQEETKKVGELLESLPEPLKGKLGGFTIVLEGLKLKEGGNGILHRILRLQGNEPWVFSFDQVLRALKSPQGQKFLTQALMEIDYTEWAAKNFLDQAGLLAKETNVEKKESQPLRESKAREGPRPSPDAGKGSPEQKEKSLREFRKEKGEQILRHTSLDATGNGEFVFNNPYTYTAERFFFRFDAGNGQWMWRDERVSWQTMSYRPADSTNPRTQKGRVAVLSVIRRLRWVNETKETVPEEQMRLHDNREGDGETHIKRWRNNVRRVGGEWELDVPGLHFTEYFFWFDDRQSAWVWRSESETTYHLCTEVPKNTTAQYVVRGLQSVNETKQDMYTWRRNSRGEPFKTAPPSAV